MSTAELKAKAKGALAGKWGKSALMILCYLLITATISFVLGLIPVVGNIISLIISLPISYGLIASFMRLRRGEAVSATDFLNSGLSNIGKVWGVYGHTLLKLLVPTIIAIVCMLVVTFSTAASFTAGIMSGSSIRTAGFSGIAIIAYIGFIVAIIFSGTKGLLYSLTNYILFDNPNMSSKAIVEESERLMRGNRWNYVWLSLTFIGWIILSFFTFYIGLLWVIPYILITNIFFYEALSGNTQNVNPIEGATNIDPISTDDGPIS